MCMYWQGGSLTHVKRSIAAIDPRRWTITYDDQSPIAVVHGVEMPRHWSGGFETSSHVHVLFKVKIVGQDPYLYDMKVFGMRFEEIADRTWDGSGSEEDHLRPKPRDVSSNVEETRYPITTRSMKEIAQQLPGVLASMMEHFVRQPLGTDEPREIDPRGPRVKALRKSIETRQARTRVTPEHLREVAAVYRAHPRNPRRHIAQQFNTSESNANRWIRLAREEGILGPSLGKGIVGEAGAEDA